MNDLLAWMSARRSGSMQSFRGRVAELSAGHARGRHTIAAHHVARWNLAKLGHSEFEEAARGGWRVAPPVLAAGGISGPSRAVLCGARSAELLSKLTARADAEHIEASNQTAGPDVIGLAAPCARDLTGIAHDIGIPIQWNAPLAILAACQRVKAMILEERSIPVGAGWTVTRFSKSGLAWVPATAADAQTLRAGFFRFRGDYGTTYVLKEAGHAFTCDPATGKYRVLQRRHRPLVYDPGAQELAIAASCRPPELVERALVVASGCLPEFRDKRLVYSRVARATAECAANLVGQRLY
jgi:hypothetical protein